MSCFTEVVPAYPRPKRLVMIPLNGCDMCPNGRCNSCRSEETRCITIGNDIHFGWQCCNCQPCVEKMKLTQRIYVVPKERLDRVFGSIFKVLRSSGEVDVGGWKLAYATKETSQFGIIANIDEITYADTNDYTAVLRCVTQPVEKSVPLSVLLEWNDLNAI